MYGISKIGDRLKLLKNQTHAEERHCVDTIAQRLTNRLIRLGSEKEELIVSVRGGFDALFEG